MTLVQSPTLTVEDATMIIQDGIIQSTGKGITIPEHAVVIDCSGLTLYPAFIDLACDAGIPEKPKRREVTALRWKAMTCGQSAGIRQLRLNFLQPVFSYQTLPPTENFAMPVLVLPDPPGRWHHTGNWRSDLAGR